MIGAISSRTGSGSDYSADFTRVRSSIRTPDGSGYIPFIASLRPRFTIVFRDITLGYEALLTTALLLNLSDGLGWLQGIAALVGAVSIGFWIAYLQLFMHEAAHFNLTRNRKWNDLSWISP